MTADLWLLFKPEGMLQRTPASANQLVLIKKLELKDAYDIVIALSE